MASTAAGKQRIPKVAKVREPPGARGGDRAASEEPALRMRRRRRRLLREEQGFGRRASATRPSSDITLI